MTPRLIDYFQDTNGKHYKLPPPQPDRQAVSEKTASQIHNILLEVVKRGTGVAGQYKGLEIGGKTGTAHIATSRGYSRQYHSSFFGFANDNSGHKYTIGVLVIRVKKRPQYFASKSAVPTFRKITNALVELHYLQPELTPEELEEEQEKEAAKDRKRMAREAREAARLERESASGSRQPVKPKPARPKPIQKTGPSHELFNDLDMF